MNSSLENKLEKSQGPNMPYAVEIRVLNRLRQERVNGRSVTRGIKFRYTFLLILLTALLMATLAAAHFSHIKSTVVHPPSIDRCILVHKNSNIPPLLRKTMGYP